MLLLSQRGLTQVVFFGQISKINSLLSKWAAFLRLLVVWAVGLCNNPLGRHLLAALTCH